MAVRVFPPITPEAVTAGGANVFTISCPFSGQGRNQWKALVRNLSPYALQVTGGISTVWLAPFEQDYYEFSDSEQSFTMIAVALPSSGGTGLQGSILVTAFDQSSGYDGGFPVSLSTQGPQGSQGAQGAQGAQGPQGATGGGGGNSWTPIALYTVNDAIVINGTPTYIPPDSKVYDVYSAYAYAVSTFTAPSTAVYRFMVQGIYQAEDNDDFGAIIWALKNGAGSATYMSGLNSGGSAQVSSLAYWVESVELNFTTPMDSGDTFTFKVFTTGGGLGSDKFGAYASALCSIAIDMAATPA